MVVHLDDRLEAHRKQKVGFALHVKHAVHSVYSIHTTIQSWPIHFPSLSVMQSLRNTNTPFFPWRSFSLPVNTDERKACHMGDGYIWLQVGFNIFLVCIIHTHRHSSFTKRLSMLTWLIPIKSHPTYFFSFVSDVKLTFAPVMSWLIETLKILFLLLISPN